MKKLHHWIVGGACLLLGVTLLGIGPLQEYWQNRYVPRVLASPFLGSTSPVPAVPALISGRPVRLNIPALGLDLPVINGYYNVKTQKWTLTNDKVQYATITPLANNQEGNTFLYGHNRKEVFHTLNHLRIDDEAVITTDNGHIFTYRLAGVLETTPTDDSLFRYQGKPILTIQTCSGLWYQNRQLFTFNLENAR